jgi:hypothetical protein
MSAKKAKQLTFPGMKAPKPVKPVKEEVTSSGKASDKLLQKDKLRSEMVAGNRPMFMTAGEVIRLGNLSDAGYRNNAPLHMPKSNKQKNAEKYIMDKKLKESKTGTIKNSHLKADYQTGWTIHNGQEVRSSSLPSLHDSIAEEGFKGSFPLGEANAKEYKLSSNKPGKNITYVNVFEGHHRLAAMRNLHPKQFIPIEWHKD